MDTAIGKRYIPVTEWNNFHPWPTTKAWYNISFQGNENRLSKAIIKAGKRLLIDEDKFTELMNGLAQA